MLKIVIAFTMIAAQANAQNVVPPTQPTTGPGGRDYLYPSYQKLGPYYGDPADDPYSAFYIFEPAGGTIPASLPVALFLHGELAPTQGYTNGDSPANYIRWIVHLARMGYTVVFPAYDTNRSPVEYAPDIVESWQAALSLLQSGGLGLIAPAVDSQGIQTVFSGHSMGAYQTFTIAQQLTTTPIPGVPLPRAIAAFEPGIGRTGFSTDFSNISPSVSVVLVYGDEDTPNIPTALSIWHSIANAIPPANRDILELISDSHGSPAQLGNHYYPDTNGYRDNGPGVDGRDYNVTWKLSVGIFNCVLYGTDCSYGLGHGATDQLNMGNWSDGTPVTLLTLQNAN